MISPLIQTFLTAKVNGTTLAYCEEGEGDPVVFVHGGVSDLRAWEQQLPEIGRSYRAITYSRRYARPNDDIEPEVADPWDAHCSDLAAFIHDIGAAPAHIVASSQGAYIALLTAISTPEIVRTLVLAEPPLLPLFVSFPPQPLEILRLLVTRPRVGIAMLRFVFGTVEPVTKKFQRGEDDQALESFLRGVLGRESFEKLTPALLEPSRENLGTLRAAMLHPGFPPVDDEEVRSVSVPTLLVTGERSPPFLLRVTDRLEELLANVERVEIRDSSHGVHFEQPSLFNRAVLDFLSRRG